MSDERHSCSLPNNRLQQTGRKRPAAEPERSLDNTRSHDDDR